MNPHALEALYERLGRPGWFWPLVISVVLIGCPLAMSALEAA